MLDAFIVTVTLRLVELGRVDTDRGDRAYTRLRLFRRLGARSKVERGERMEYLIVFALAGHGVFDYFHYLFIRDFGVPAWWPGFCLSFDVVGGGFLALLLRGRSGFASKQSVAHV